MKVCKYCGTLNDDDQGLCKSCGGLLPTKKKRAVSLKEAIASKPAVRKIALAVLAGVVAVGAGVTVFAGGASRRVEHALEQNRDAIVEAASALPELAGARDNFGALNDGGRFTVKMDITADIMSVEGSMDYDRKEKALAGTIAYANVEKELDVKFDFASDNREFVLAADRYTDDLYGFKLKEFAAFYSKTPIALLFPLDKTQKEPNIEFFRKVDFAQSMDEKYGDAWKNFRKSLDYEELNERDMEIGGEMIPVRAYEVTWDSTAASKLISAMLGQKEGLLDDLIRLFKFMEPDCRFYVNEEGYIVAVDFVVSGNKCTIKFEGERNVWERCTLSSLSIAGGEGAISGYLIIEDGEVDARFELNQSMCYELHYTDSTGEFSMSAVTEKTSWNLDGAITSRNGGSQLRMGGYLPNHGRVDVTVELNPLENEPELIDDKYVDLMDMKASNWQRLLIDINNSQ